MRRQAERSLATQQHGALARDGISSMVCHHMAVTSRGQGLSYTDNFVTGPASGVQASDYLLELIRDAWLLVVAGLLAWRPQSRLALDSLPGSEEP